MNPKLPWFSTLLAITALISATTFTGFWYYSNNVKAANTQTSQNNSSVIVQNTSNSSQKESSQPKLIYPNTLRLNTLFMGDVFWGRYVDDWSKASPLKFAYPFSGLNTFEKEKYNAWIGGLECPITSTYLSSKTQDSLLKFSCPVEYTAEAAKWFDAFTLANNHTDNMEEVAGFEQTKNNLDNNGIQYFGHFDNANTQDICQVLSFKATPIFENPQELSDQEYYIPMALCGFHNVFKLPTDQELSTITQYAKYFPTIAMPHQGKEYTFKADSLQTQYAKKMIDLGADAIIGNHVHSTQNTEVYKDKLIVYSLGNFIFDQQRTAQVTQAVLANLDFSFEVDTNLKEFLKFSKTCQLAKDNCLELAQKANLTKPKFEIKYDLICSDNSQKLAKKASAEVCKNLYRITNWTQTQTKLNI